MMLCVVAIAVTSLLSSSFFFLLSLIPLKLRPAMKRNDGIELLERRVPMGSKFQPYEVCPRGVQERPRPI
jgi:hypothetical protein